MPGTDRAAGRVGSGGSVRSAGPVPEVVRPCGPGRRAGWGGAGCGGSGCAGAEDGAGPGCGARRRRQAGLRGTDGGRPVTGGAGGTESVTGGADGTGPDSAGRAPAETGGGAAGLRRGGRRGAGLQRAGHRQDGRRGSGLRRRGRRGAGSGDVRWLGGCPPEGPVRGGRGIPLGGRGAAPRAGSGLPRTRDGLPGGGCGSSAARTGSAAGEGEAPAARTGSTAGEGEAPAARTGSTAGEGRGSRRLGGVRRGRGRFRGDPGVVVRAAAHRSRRGGEAVVQGIGRGRGAGVAGGVVVQLPPPVVVTTGGCSPLLTHAPDCPPTEPYENGASGNSGRPAPRRTACRGTCRTRVARWSGRAVPPPRGEPLGDATLAE